MSIKKLKNKFKQIITVIVFIIVIIGYFNPNVQETINNVINEQVENTISYDLGEIPEYTKEPYIIINNNIPGFTEEDFTTEAFEVYSKLDNLGRCGVAYANICKEIMPSDKEGRESLSYKPTAWKQKRYKGIIDGDYLYNRCHLIGWQLTGENDNKLNLITGTQYMNVQGMLPFENKVDDYFEKKQNEDKHVLYRVTPIFKGNNLVASGVQIEAYSVEDNGKGVCFNVYIYNVQPGIVIDYETGESWLE